MSGPHRRFARRRIADLDRLRPRRDAFDRFVVHITMSKNARARERHLVDAGVRDQRIADHTSLSDDDIQYSRRYTGFEREFA